MKAAFALVQEPYVGAEGVIRQYSGVRVVQKIQNRNKPVKAAIIILDGDIEVVENPMLLTENVASVILKTSTWTLGILSIYLEGDQPLEPYLKQIKEILVKIKINSIIIGGDVNAWSTWWGSSSEDHRGAELAGFLEEIQVHILNEGKEPTFETIRGGKLYQSRVDITVCSLNMLSKIENWKVDKSITSSDHNSIIFEVKMEKPVEIKCKNTSTRKYNTKKGKWKKFKTVLNSELEREEISLQKVQEVEGKEELEEIVKIYTNCVDIACKKSIPEVKQIRKVKIPWWNDKLDKLKKNMTTKKRRIRCAAPTRRQHVVQEYLQAKEEYEQEATKSQTESWKEFCTAQDRETVWDGIYRVIARTATRQEDQLLVADGKVLSPEESAQLLAATFFPKDEEMEDKQEHRRIRLETEQNMNIISDFTNDPLFTMAELKQVMYSFSPKKAPGADGFTSDICSAAIEVSGEIFLTIINKCLILSLFPTPWKLAIIKVLRKPGKPDYSHVKAYRPIGLLSVFGKVLEKMMVRRLRWHLLPKLNPRQYGFVPQRCTEDSLYDLVMHIRERLKHKEIIVVVSLDIEGAFDSAWWPSIKLQLYKKKCPGNLYRLVNDYFKDRKVLVRYSGAEHIRETTKGCIQGSIGGPTFWNLLLDSLLDDMDARGVYCQAFADDVVLIFSGKLTADIQALANQTLAHVHAWGSVNKLKFAPHKTQAMIITNKLKFDIPRMHMGGSDIEIVNQIKILGLTIDNKLTFNNHASLVCRKATNLYKQLARAARVSWGLNPEVIRTIYVAVIEPIIMYAASVWAPAAKKLTIRKQLDTVQRGFAQKICRSYRTVSLSASLILARLIPLDLRIQEVAALYEAKRGKPLDQVIGDRELEARVSFLKAPHPETAIEIDFQCLENLQPDTLKEYDIKGPMIFTDGSKIEGKVGAALSWWKEEREIKSSKFKLEDFCTVFQAEMFALHQATSQILKSKEKFVNILSDSRSSLELLKNQETFHPLAFQIRKNITMLHSQGRNVHLFWIKAHVGVLGNERADELAKNAALNKKTAPDYDKCPISYIKREIRKTSVDIWQKRYEEGETAAVTKQFFPNVQSAYRIINKISLTPILTQVFTGHGGFSQYLHRFKCKDSFACICDSETEETILHLLIECPKYVKLRMECEIKMEDKITKENLANLIEGKTKRDIFINFCLRIAKDAIKRNKTT